MGSVISKTPNNIGVYRYLPRVNAESFSSDEWERNPDISNVSDVDERFWKYDNSNVVVSMTQEEQANLGTALENAEALTNESGEFQFGNRGRTANRWLRTATYMMPSIRMPYVFLNDGVITGFNYLSYTNESDTDIRLYKNGKLYYTWQVRGMRYAYKTNDLTHLKFEKGDQVAVYMKRVGSSIPIYPLVTVQYRYNIQLTGEGGLASL